MPIWAAVWVIKKVSVNINITNPISLNGFIELDTGDGSKKTQVNGYNLMLSVKAGGGGWGGPTSNQACLKLVVRNESTSWLFGFNNHWVVHFKKIVFTGSEIDALWRSWTIVQYSLQRLWQITGICISKQPVW